MNLTHMILRRWLETQENKPPRLRPYYFCNRSFNIAQEAPAAQTSDKSNALRAEPYKGHVTPEDLKAVKAGARDMAILPQKMNNDRGLAGFIKKTGRISKGNSLNAESDCSLFFLESRLWCCPYPSKLGYYCTTVMNFRLSIQTIRNWNFKDQPTIG